MYPFNQIRFYLVVSIIAFMLMTLFYENTKLELRKTQNELNKYQTNEGYIPAGDIQKTKLIDSLNTELFNANNVVGRYELSLEHLYEVNPKAAKQFDEFLNNETE